MKLVVFVNPGGSGDNFGIGDAENGEVLHDTKVKPNQTMPTCVVDQLPIRRASFLNWTSTDPIAALLKSNEVAAIVSRGPALLKDIKGQPDGFGIYTINDRVISAIEKGHVYTIHPSQLGPVIASEWAAEQGVPALMVDPISCLSLPFRRRLSGLPGVERRPLGHWLNIHRVLLQLFGNDWKSKSIIVIHLGTGATVAAFRDGNLVNVNDANAGGPFTDTRAGGLPTEQLIDFTTAKLNEGWTAQQVKELLQTKCGLAGYLGLPDLKQVVELIRAGTDRSPLAAFYYQAMVEQTVEEISARYANLNGKVDNIVITGGMANERQLVADITEGILWMGAVKFDTIPGSFEAQAMVNGARRYLAGETPIEYGEFA